MLVLFLATVVAQVDPVELRPRLEVEGEKAKPVVERIKSMPPLPSHVATDAEKAEIARLIKRLAEIKDPDVGLSPGMSGSAFAPVEELNEFGSGILMNHGHQRNQTLVKLVAFGPKAVPQLLAALDDETPTRLTLEHDGFFGYMGYCDRFLLRAARRLKWKNHYEAPPGLGEVALYNPRDAEMIAKEMAALPPRPSERGSRFNEKHFDKYTVTVGDVCYLALGQIVNRGYAPSQYQPTPIVCVSSTKHDKQLVADVRSRWGVKDVDREVFEALMLDFLYDDDRGAAVRLGFYYPKESEPLLLDAVGKAVAAAKQKDDYYVRQKLEAYAAIPLPSVRAAVWSFARDSKYLYYFLAGLPAAPPVVEEPYIERLLSDFFDEAFQEHKDLYKRYEMQAVWRAGLKRFGNAEFLRKQFERAAKTDDEETRISVCENIPDEWAKVILAPFLKDTRKLKRWQDDTRMCDLAAEMIKHADQSLRFDRAAAAAARDKQIEVLYHHCTGLGVRREPKP